VIKLIWGKRHGPTYSCIIELKQQRESYPELVQNKQSISYNKKQYESGSVREYIASLI
jgi:hypothetical protein